MKIHGFQKTTLLDYPGRVACTVFTGGCDFRCPFCHNATLVLDPDSAPTFDEDEIIAYLIKRKGILDGLCVTGGEPLLSADIADFLRRVKGVGLDVKVDTNGTFPERLKSLVSEGLVDYVAMDIKNSPEKYGQTAGVPNMRLDKINESVSYLLSGAVDFEFRTTAVNELHEPDDFDKIGRWIAGAPRYFIQAYKDSGNILAGGLTPMTKEGYLACLDKVRPYVPNAEIRGID